MFSFGFSRRHFLIAAAATALPLSSTIASSMRDTIKDKQMLALERLSSLEAASGGRLGVAALNTANGELIQFRAAERFPMCSTCKTLVAAAILKRSSQNKSLLNRRIKYSKADILSYSSTSEKNLKTGMTVKDLCAATLMHSDNTAANLLMKQLGGPEAVTAFVRSLGDELTRLDRWEPELNTALPGDERDTTTPAAMVKNLQALLLGDALDKDGREQLVTWMRGNQTGATRIRAGVPANWIVADKTGSGAYGSTNDIGVLWPLDAVSATSITSAKTPIVLAIYFTQANKDADTRNDVVASAARIVSEAFSAA